MDNSSDSAHSASDVYCIFLHIVEGIGLYPKDRTVLFTDRHKDKIILTAVLNGVKFEIEGHSTETATIFNSNCIWECSLGDIKRMKTDNRPVKVECFISGGGHDHTLRKSIGSLLLPIRGVQTIASLRDIQFKIHWHKLNGLNSEWRKLKPEIYLLLIIVKRTLLDVGQLEKLLGKKKPSTDNLLRSSQSETSLMLHSQRNVYVQLVEKISLIQVGNDPEIDCDIFNVMITFKQLKNVTKLLDVARKGSSRAFTPAFHYDFYGSVYAVEVIAESDDCYNINEKISLSYRTSISSLRLYFQQIFYIPINLYANGIQIASHRLNLSKLLPDDHYFDMLKLWTKNDDLQFESSEIVRSPQEPIPTVDFIFCVKLISSQSKRNDNGSNAINETFFDYDIDDKAAGDMATQRYLTYSPTNMPKSARLNNNSSLLPSTCIPNLQLQERSYINVGMEPSVLDRNEVCYKKSEEFIKQAAIAKEELSKNAAHSSKSIDSGKTVIERTVEKNLDRTAIRQQIDPHIKINIDENVLMNENKTVNKQHIGPHTESKAVQYEMMTTSTAVNTEPLDMSASTPDSMTEDLALKIVQELEDWKAQQMDHFLIGLERKETEYMAALEIQWRQQRAILQAQLLEKIAHCENLNAKLETAEKELNASIVKIKKSQIVAEKVKRDIEFNYANKFQTLIIQKQHLKMEMQQKIQKLEIEKNDLQYQKTKLERESSEHKERVVQLEKQLAAMAETHLSANQLDELLADLRLQTERSAEVEKTKDYYKAKWVRSTHEVHKLKLNLLKQKKKLMLKQEEKCIDICLEEILDEEQNALKTDRDELQVIKASLDESSDSSSICDLSDK